jgi:hypothetical protein
MMIEKGRKILIAHNMFFKSGVEEMNPQPTHHWTFLPLRVSERVELDQSQRFGVHKGF